MLENLGSLQPDCIVLDLQMPDMGGLELMRHIARIRVGIPVIVITGNDTASTRSESLALGACDYLPNPIDGDRLISSVLKSIGAHPR